MVSFPGGDFHLLTTDTNDYYHPSLSADGQSIAANQSQSRIQLEIAPAGSLENFIPIRLSSNLPFSDWDWTPDDQVLLTQGTDIRLVNPAGANRAVFSDLKFPIEGVVSCGEGRYVVFRSIGRSGGAEANLWRIDANGTNLKQLTSGVNERTPACSNDGKWLYYIDAAENHFLKRIPIEGGASQTIIKSPPNRTAFRQTARAPQHSKSAKRITPPFSFCTLSKMEKNRHSNSTRADSRASPSFLPEKRSSYAVREKGVDNLWIQPLDGAARRQLTHFTSEKIGGFAYSKDGKRLGVGRGHADSDAVLLRNIRR